MIPVAGSSSCCQGGLGVCAWHRSDQMPLWQWRGKFSSVPELIHHSQLSTPTAPHLPSLEPMSKSQDLELEMT